MGTNYYLAMPEMVCPTCGHDTSRDLHIGKSSAGWVFAWRGYRGQENPAGRELVSPTAWFAYLEEATADGSRVILNEYSDVVSLEDFTARVLRKRTSARKDADEMIDGDCVIFDEFS